MNTITAPIKSFHFKYIYTIAQSSDKKIHSKSRIPNSLKNAVIPQNIEYLNLSNNCIQDESGVATLRILQQLKNIKHIDLSNNFLEKSTLNILPLLTFEKLNMVDFSRNEMDIASLNNAQDQSKFIIKHQHLTVKKFNVSYDELNSSDLFKFNKDDLEPTRMVEMTVSTNNIKIPLLIPQITSDFPELDKAANNSKVCEFQASILTSISTSFMTESGLIFLFLISFLIRNTFLNLISILDQLNIEGLNEKLIRLNENLQKNSINELSNEDVDELNDFYNIFNKDLHPNNISQNLPIDEIDHYCESFYELHICLKVILASIVQEHKVNLNQFELIYSNYLNTRYFNPGFIYNSVILGLVSQDAELTKIKFEHLNNQINGDDTTSTNLKKIVSLLREAIIHNFGMNELDL